MGKVLSIYDMTHEQRDKEKIASCIIKGERPKNNKLKIPIPLKCSSLCFFSIHNSSWPKN